MARSAKVPNNILFLIHDFPPVRSGTLSGLLLELTVLQVTPRHSAHRPWHCRTTREEASWVFRLTQNEILYM